MGVSAARKWRVGAGLWGFAEATFFFIVPDVLLTASLLSGHYRRALRLCLIASIAAAMGGLVMWFWGAYAVDSARAFLLRIPLIAPDLLARVGHEITSLWPWNLAKGAVTGAPYKIYAVEAGANGVNPLNFAIASIPARLARFVLIVSAAALIKLLLIRLGKMNWAPWLLIGFWVALYIVYGKIRLAAGN
ncbi:MAG: hypothetical protein AAGB02_04050 [Pseudomonadota bacterium]